MNYHWTNHAKYKMRFYRLSEQMVRGIISRPKRVEEGIAPNTIAYMKGAGSVKKPHEIWVMVAKGDQNKKLNIPGLAKAKPRAGKYQKHNSKTKNAPDKFSVNGQSSNVTRVISAWRYPGVTKPGSPLPREIMQEIEEAK